MNAPRPPWVYRLLHPACEAAVSALSGTEIEGLDRVPPEGRLIVAFNHRSWWDGPLASMVVARKRFPCFIAKEELFRNPVAGWFLRRVGVMPLDRRRGDVVAMRAAVAILEREGCLLMFPEGTRSRTGAPGRPKPGVGFLAHAAAAPVLPVRIWNTERFPSRTPIRMKFGSVLRYHGDGDRRAYQGFSEEVMEAIFRL